MRATVAFLLTCLLCATTGAQVCTGDITLTTQAEVDAFACGEVEGNLVIQGTGVSDLVPMRGLETVTGRVTITETTQLTSLDGLDSLQRVSGGLVVGDNAGLSTLDGLSGLTTLRWIFWVFDNPALESLGRLGATGAALDLEDVEIIRNPKLLSLDGLQAVSTTHDFYVSDNARLTSLRGMEGLTQTKKFIIYNNPDLSSLSGVGALQVTTNIEIGDNDALQSLDGLTALSEANGYVYVGENDALVQCSCGLAGLIEDGEYVNLWSITISNNAGGGTCTSPSDVLANPCAATAGEGGPDTGLSLAVAPNPSPSVARATYSLPTAGEAQVAVYDALGRQIAMLADGPHAPGDHEVALGTLAPGVYLVRVVTEAAARTAAVTVAR